VRIAEETSPPKASGVIWLEGQKGNRDEKENAGHDRTENARVKLDVSMDADEAVSTANISPAAEVAQPEPPPVQQLAEQFKQAGILVPSAELEPEWDLDKDQIRAAAKIGERGEESE
jgi:hypothetical protein